MGSFSFHFPQLFDRADYLFFFFLFFSSCFLSQLCGIAFSFYYFIGPVLSIRSSPLNICLRVFVFFFFCGVSVLYPYVLRRWRRSRVACLPGNTSRKKKKRESSELLLYGDNHSCCTPYHCIEHAETRKTRVRFLSLSLPHCSTKQR